MIASFFGVGYIPYAPGTAASFAALIPLYFLVQYTSAYTLIVSIFLFILGTYSTHKCIQNQTDHDPSWIVIDEVVGVFLLYPLCPLISQNNSIIVIAVLLFRFFDIFKWGPVKYVNDKIKSAWGVMLDDVVASILSALTITLSYHILTALY